MRFAHEAADFADLLGVAAAHRSIAITEKDYWVTHALWALHAQGFAVWFKGGTSLSKGFGLIERFSEDLDLKIEPGAVASVPPIENWKSDKSGPVAIRRAHFEAFARELDVPGMTAELVEVDTRWRSAHVRLRYAGQYLAGLAPVLSPFVLLELGTARVTPFVECTMSSFVHDALVSRGLLADYAVDNRPHSVRCVHPLVTLLEKLEALERRALDPKVAPAKFVRHFEDAARVIGRGVALPPLPDYGSARALADDLVREKQLRALPRADHGAFAPDASARWVEIGAAHREIGPMFWGPRLTLDDSCASIRGWIDANIARS